MSRIEIRSYSFSALLYCTVSQFLQRRCSRIMHMSKRSLETNTTNKWKFDRNTYRFIPLKAVSLRRKLLRLWVLYQLIALHDLRGFIYIIASLWTKCESFLLFFFFFLYFIVLSFALQQRVLPCRFLQQSAQDK